MVIVTQTVNSDEFLYLKQLLCMIGVIRLNRCIKINNEEVNYENLRKEAQASLHNLTGRFEVPTMVLRTDRSTINFGEVLKAVEEYGTHDIRITSLKQKQLTQKDIFGKPDKNGMFLLYRNDFWEEEGLFINQRVNVAKILNMCEGFFNCVGSYIQHDSSTITLSEAVTCLNMLEGMEYTFTLSEEGEAPFQKEPVTEFKDLFDVSALKKMVHNDKLAREMPGVEVEEMIDEDRLAGLTAEEVEEVIAAHNGNVEDGVDHPVAMLDGFESLLKSKFDPSQFSGNERYFIGAMRPYAIVGNEAGFWDNVKESSKVIYDTLIKAINEITNYFTGDSTKQITDAETKYQSAIEAMKKINGSIPVPENSALLTKEKYFKEPSVDGLNDTDLTIVNKGIADIKAAVSKLDGVKDVTGLIAGLDAIGSASISSANAVTNQIKKDASEASAAAGKIQNPTLPKDDEAPEVKKAKQDEIQQDIKDAKDKGNGVKKIAAIRNKFLAPALVVAASLSGVEKLKENKEFKG